MLKIRLRRMGAKKDSFYRIVVSDSRSTPQGRFVDVLGTYDPTSEASGVKLDLAKAEEWISKGAHASATVRSLISQVKRSNA